MRFLCTDFVILLTLVLEGDGEHDGDRGFLRMKRVLGRSCTEPVFPDLVRDFPGCVPGSTCEMLPIAPDSFLCPAGNCTGVWPYCVRSLDLPSVASLADNPGSCPHSESSTNTKGGIFCTDDTSCGINQKCCVNGNRIECVNVTSDVGSATFEVLKIQAFGAPMSFIENEYCPTVSTGAFLDSCGNGWSCNADSDCPGRQKCCVAGCGKLCLNHVDLISALTSGDIRSSDKGFANATVNVAGADVYPNTYVDTEFSKRGVCPSVAIDAIITNSSSCLNDMDCDGTQKCCAIALGLGCVEANQFIRLPPKWEVSGINDNGRSNSSVFRTCASCPNVSPVINGECGVECTGDNSCPSGTLCCQLGACIECLNPIINPVLRKTRAGMCPIFAPNISSSCAENCQDDTDCPNPVMKCCKMGCGRSCVNPVATLAPMIKSGSCPNPSVVQRSGPSSCNGCWRGLPREQPPNGLPKGLPRTLFEGRIRRQADTRCIDSPLRYKQCRHDAHCGGSQQCCPTRCDGLYCTDPM